MKMMDKIYENREQVILICVGIWIGLVIGLYFLSPAECRDSFYTESRMELTYVDACNLGCYYLLELIGERGEQVNPTTYELCKINCQNHYARLSGN